MVEAIRASATVPDVISVPFRLLKDEPPPMKFAAVINTAVLAVGTLACLFINISVAFGFAVGYIIGVLNALWLRRTAKKITSLPLAKVGRHVALNYYLRFFFNRCFFCRAYLPEADKPVVNACGACGFHNYADNTNHPVRKRGGFKRIKCII
jgi:hypothetical protein